MPGVGTPEPQGLLKEEFLSFIKSKQLTTDPYFLGLEIVEYNPHHDIQEKTLRGVEEILQAVFQ